MHSRYYYLRNSSDLIGREQWCFQLMDHFTAVCLVALSLNENKDGTDLVLIETSCFFYVNDTVLMLISRKLNFYQNKVNSSLTFIQRSGN